MESDLPFAVEDTLKSSVSQTLRDIQECSEQFESALKEQDLDKLKDLLAKLKQMPVIAVVESEIQAIVDEQGSVQKLAAMIDSLGEFEKIDLEDVKTDLPQFKQTAADLLKCKQFLQQEQSKLEQVLQRLQLQDQAWTFLQIQEQLYLPLVQLQI